MIAFRRNCADELMTSKFVAWNGSHSQHGDVPLVFISLEDAVDRRNALIRRGFPPGLVASYWPAFDMRHSTQEQLQSQPEAKDMTGRYGRRPLGSEVGCFISHREVIRWFAKQSKYSQIVVFEDDAIPAFDDSFDLLANLSDSLKPHADSGKSFICHLGPRPEQWETALVRRITKKSISVRGLEVLELVGKRTIIWRAHSYIISKAAADKYVSLTSKSAFLADDWRLIMDSTKSKMFLAHPRLFVQDEIIKSSIDPDNARTSLIAEARSTNASKKVSQGNIHMIKALMPGRFKRSIRVAVASCYKRLPRIEF